MSSCTQVWAHAFTFAPVQEKKDCVCTLCHCVCPFITARKSVCVVACGLVCVCGGRGPSSLSESRTVKVSPPWWRGCSFTGGQQLPGFQQLVQRTPHKLVVRGLGNLWRKGRKPQDLQRRAKVRGQSVEGQRVHFYSLSFTHTHTLQHLWKLMRTML